MTKPTAYRLRETFGRENIIKGTVVYRQSGHDYGLAGDDTRLTGVEHISVTLNKNGDYPGFTIPRYLLEEITAEEAEKSTDNGPWPKTVVVYLHSSKERMYEHGERMGLKDEALSKFSYALYELAVSISVEKDGSYNIEGFSEK